jgi:hypothetical protein
MEGIIYNGNERFSMARIPEGKKERLNDHR